MMMNHRRGSKVEFRLFASFLLFFLTTVTAHGRVNISEKVPYYGSKLYEDLYTRKRHPKLKNELNRILSYAHIIRENDFDELRPDCDEYDSTECYQHHYQSYRKAREYMFGYVHLQANTREYWLTTIYCRDVHSSRNFPSGRPPGPMQIPNHRIVNAEHIWPQSLFSHEYHRGLQKSDLHALYPANSSANSSRNNHPFGEIDDVIHSPCPGTVKGYIDGLGNNYYFEPPDEVKGIVARAIFYFATRYDLELDDIQEGFLRAWHEAFPPRADEIQRHEMIFEIQKTRNPYVDHPELVNLVENF